MVMEKQAIQKIKNLMEELKVPYYYVNASKNYKTILSYGENEGKMASGNEKLFMFSCTKPLTVICGLKLIEKGLMSFDDKVYKYLPFIKDCYIEKDNKKEVVGDKITVKHLFTMTAGFNYNYNAKPLKEAFAEGKNPDTIEVLKAICKSPLVSYPGERFNYSFCHDFLAGVIGVVANKPFYDVVDEFILKPLNMKDSKFTYTDDDFEVNYYRYEKGGYIKLPLYNYLVPSKNWNSGGASLISTANDYLKFIKVLANGGISEDGVKIVEKETIDLMYSEQVKTVSVNNNFTCVQGEDYGYGYGVRTRIKETSWGLPIGEFGWDGMAGSYLMVDPINNVSVFIAMHVEMWPDFFLNKHLEIVKIIYENLI